MLPYLTALSLVRFLTKKVIELKELEIDVQFVSAVDRGLEAL